MDSTDINKFDGLFWLALAQSLPAEGVACCFPDEPARLNRLIDVRWPHGPNCRKCGNEGVSWIKTRHLFQCEQCRYQFSATSGTALHRSRLSLGIWFGAVETIIHYRSRIYFGDDMPARALALKLDIQYVSARRMRKIINAEIVKGDAGLLLPTICAQPLGYANF